MVVALLKISQQEKMMMASPMTKARAWQLISIAAYQPAGPLSNASFNNPRSTKHSPRLRSNIRIARPMSVDTRTHSRSRTYTAVTYATASNTLETTSNSSEGVMVECFKEGSKLRIRVVSQGYDYSWNVQFPKDIREEGARYMVEEIMESSCGGF